MLDKGAAAEMLGGKDSVTHLPDDKGTRRPYRALATIVI